MFDLPCGMHLRPFHATPAVDLDHILGLYNNAQVAPLITQRFVVPRGDGIKDEFKDIIDKKAEMFCIIESPRGPLSPPEFAGFTALWAGAERGHRCADYSIILLPQFWGKGYGKSITTFMLDYAFIHLNMHRISLSVYEGNERAIAVYHKTGFIDEGQQRKAFWANGKWHDMCYMGILLEDWEQSRK